MSVSRAMSVFFSNNHSIQLCPQKREVLQLEIELVHEDKERGSMSFLKNA